MFKVALETSSPNLENTSFGMPIVPSKVAEVLFLGSCVQLTFVIIKASTQGEKVGTKMNGKTKVGFCLFSQMRAVG